MYFLILRPQQKRVKQHQEMVKNVRRGDTVVTNGGLIGKVTKVIDDDQIEIEIADDVRIRQMRQMVTDVRAKGEPVKDEEPSPAKRRRPWLNQAAVGTTCFISRGGKRRRFCLRRLSSALFAVPNFLPEKMVQSWPKWAQRHVVLGLDLAGRLAHPARSRHATRCARRSWSRCAMMSAACCAMRASGIPVSSVRGQRRRSAHPRGQQFRSGGRQTARTLAASRRHSGSSTGQRTLDVTTEAGSLVRLTLTEPGDRRAGTPIGRAVDLKSSSVASTSLALSSR